jgi:hypothetical protein
MLLAALIAWSVVLLVANLLYASAHHLVFLGTDSRFPLDQLQYLAWVGDYAHHWLAGNLLDLASPNRVFLDPMWLVSGLLVRVGTSVQLALLIWKPVAVVALFFGVRAYVRRHLPAAGRSRELALLLALFAFTPGLGFIQVTGVGSANTHNQVSMLVFDLFVGDFLWGYLPAALAVAAIPVCLLAAERVLAHDGRDRRMRDILTASVAGLLAAWLHPWQGETLLIVLVLATLLERRRAAVVRITPALLAIAIPLLYYYALSKTAASWKLASLGTEDLELFSPLVLVVGLLPLLVPAAPGYLTTNWRDPGERLLMLWPVAILVLYFLPGPWRLHAFDGLTIPLAILAVRGWPVWGRRLPRTVARRPSVIAAVAIVVFVVPDLVLAERSVRDVALPTAAPAFVRSDDMRALRFISLLPRTEGVVAPGAIASAVPGFTGHATWIGHPSWTPQYAGRLEFASALFYRPLAATQVGAIVRAAGGSLLLSPCGARNALPALAPSLGYRERQFGCAAVFIRNR